MASDDPNAELSRRDLERIAFSRPATPEDAAAAESAQRQLAAQSPPPAARRSRPARAFTPVPEPVAVPEPVEGPPPKDFDDSEDDDPPRKSIRRTLLPLLVIIGLTLGATGGVLLERVSPSILSTAPTPTPTAKPTRAPGPLPNATRALAALAAPQTSVDVFPSGGFAASLDLEKDSVHRILTTQDNMTLWIAKSPQAICMLYTGVETPTGSNSGATCASVFEFGDSGLSLHFGRDQWTWDGTTFTTTIRY
jgi:hypothetical protein